MGAERHVSRSLRHVPADPRLEPLPVQVHKADQGDGGSADESGQTGEIVESLFRRRVEDPVAPEVFEPGNFALGQRQLHYRMPRNASPGGTSRRSSTPYNPTPVLCAIDEVGYPVTPFRFVSC